jgi:hypothetical protein
VSDEEQERRFNERMQNPIKRWKLSQMDLESRERWVEYSKAKDRMLKHTDSKHAPWFIVDADDKKSARLNCIAGLIHRTSARSAPFPASRLPWPPASAEAQADLLRHRGSHFGVVGRYHRIPTWQPISRPILVRRRLVLAAQVALERLE